MRTEDRSSDERSGAVALALKHWSQADVFWASGFGLGFIPFAPGTWGSVGGLLAWWWLLAELPVNIQLLICAAYFATGWWCSHRISRRFQIADAPQIVADEIVGVWLALALLPKIWWLALLAFALFRLLDIAKPGPIGWLDREVKGGFGVMADDVLAGIVSGTVLYFSVWGLHTMGVASFGY